MSDKMAIEIPEGFEKLDIRSEFAAFNGPLYQRSNPIGLGFFSEDHHSNINGVVHGGMLATLADIGLFFIASEGDDVMNGATLSLNLNYIAPAPLGTFIHAEGQVIRAGRSIIFAEGRVLGKGEVLVTFSGTIKRFTKRRASS
jgi:acyl-coenzyme A thioesterase 13